MNNIARGMVNDIKLDADTKLTKDDESIKIRLEFVGDDKIREDNNKKVDDYIRSLDTSKLKEL